MAVFRVPTQYAGKTLQQIREETGGAFRPDVIGGENIPLQAGQQISFRDDPGSGEFQFLQRYFTPEDTYQQQQQQAFQEEERGRINEFTGRVQNIPTELEAIRQQMGIPEAFQTFGTLGETARGVAQRVEDLPEAIRIATQGKDVSAGQLGRITSARQQAELPGLRDVGRALESSQAGLENLLSEFSSRTEAVYKPFEIEAGLLGDNIAQEFDLFKTTNQQNLDREIERLRQTGATDRANIDRATRLAEIEASTSQGEFRDLGDRVALINPFTGQEITSFNKGLEPKRIGTLSDEWEAV